MQLAQQSNCGRRSARELVTLFGGDAEAVEEVAPLLQLMCRENETLALVMTRRRKWYRED